MTRLLNTAFIGQTKTQATPSVWVKTRLQGTNTYSLMVVEKTKRPLNIQPKEITGCAYAKLSLMESGAVMASFPVMGMVTGTIRSMLGAAWFELAAPLKLPAFVFGHDIEIPAGRHPIVFVIESWVVLLRPQNHQGL